VPNSPTPKAINSGNATKTSVFNTGKQIGRFKRKGSMDGRLHKQVRRLKERVPGTAGVSKRGSRDSGG